MSKELAASSQQSFRTNQKTGILRRKCACGRQTPSGSSCTACMNKRPSLQRKSTDHSHIPSIVHDVLQTPGKPLDNVTQAFMEQRFQQDFSGVQIHVGKRAATSADSVGAKAYTVGQHIVFGRDEYAPNSKRGANLLAHELVHTLQQGKLESSSAINLKVIPDSTASEGEANTIANQVIQEPAPQNLELNVRHKGTNIARSINVTPLSGGPYLQMQSRRGSAGGCGICMNDPGGRIAGQVAHMEIQSAFIAMNPDIRAERGVQVVPGDTTPPFTPELDLALEEHINGLHVIHIGEIKPLDDAGRQEREGQRQLSDYARELRFTFDEVFRLRIPPPPGPLPFFNPMNPPGCPPQFIHVQQTSPGLYQYFCEPAFSDLVRQPQCRCNQRRRRRRVPQDVTVPARVPESQTDQPQSEQPETGVPVPVVVGVGAAAAAATAAAVIARRRAAEEARRRAAQLAWRKAAEAAARRRAAQAGARGAGRRVAGRAAGRALIYAEVAAAVLLIVSGEAEASVGLGGQSALEALYQSMTRNGTPPTPEMRELIENDPLLRQLAEEAANTGDVTPLQAAATQHILELLRDHPEEFTPDDLDILMQVSSASSAQGSTPQTVEELRAAIDRARARQGEAAGEGMAEGGGAGEPAREQTAAPAQTPASRETREYPGISRQWLEQLEALPTAKSLFDAMVGRTGTGPTVDDHAIEQFLNTVPNDLTQEEARQLIERLHPVRGESLNEILERLRGAIRHLRSGGEREASRAEQEDAPAARQEPPSRQPEEREGMTRAQLRERLMEAIRNYRGWDDIAVGFALVISEGETNFGNAHPRRDLIRAFYYGKAPAQRSGFTRQSAYMELHLISRSRASFVVEVVSSTPILFETGQMVPGPSPGVQLTMKTPERRR